MKEGGRAVVLVKPQFEVGRGEVGKGGIVRDPAQHARVVEEVNASARSLGLTVRGVTSSPITGADGNREFLALYEKARRVES
jgi:23S rRNA (cytidine1920-2'-O)/16S rRNA (cytidine1409-2'-O)-methyltransferase